MIEGSDVYAGGVRVSAGVMVLLISTPIRFHAETDKRPSKHQLLLEFEDKTALSCTVQMWGGMFCYPKGEEAKGIPFQGFISEAPSPLEEAFDRSYFDHLVENERPRDLTIKAFLATEQRIPGLGNGVLQDVLWTAELHPKRKMGTLNDRELAALFGAVKDVLREMRDRGGRDTERDLFGRPGGYLTILSRNTAGRHCPRCGRLSDPPATRPRPSVRG